MSLYFFKIIYLNLNFSAVHEDRPHEVAEVIASYMLRNKFAEACGDFHRQLPCC